MLLCLHVFTESCNLSSVISDALRNFSKTCIYKDTSNFSKCFSFSKKHKIIGLITLSQKILRYSLQLQILFKPRRPRDTSRAGKVLNLLFSSGSILSLNDSAINSAILHPCRPISKLYHPTSLVVYVPLEAVGMIFHVLPMFVAFGIEWTSSI